ncbi:MAG: sugar phosphate isomerase/epimerase and 4-hydroxyphenylpyruvate domain-containing protein [Ectothiorhodospiraceae bacterium]|nr:sugar phosphate isomerase/epimerase and 4-hydroxyphenylpyruvate domain-containing protein [Chromatiales bacterium]MCP5153308.1 sugar phosphate isomerase/epimerase and 4-hydroxyphenylpyruvate domain-containing protein [Ectothiorhodospiraceae bacterium]
MKRAIATTTIPGDLGEKLRAAAAAGFDGVEIFENDLLYFDRQPREVAAMAADLGLEIVAWQPFRDFEALPAAERQKAFDRAEHKFDVMGELGAPLMLVCSNVSPHALDDPARAAADLAALAERGARRGIRIGYEALAWGRHVRDYTAAWSIVEQADHPGLGIVLDSFHIFARGNSLAGIATIPSARIAMVQLADAPDITMDLLQLSRHFRCFPGQGAYPVRDFVRALARQGYDGVISHEIFSDDFRSGTPQQVAVDGMRSMVWLEEAVDTPPRTSSRSARAPAPAPLVDGIEFIEFTADEDEAKWLAQALGSLGFRHTHRHRSKHVSLYRQGDVNLVVNCERGTFAQSYHERHGISVCAIGLATSDLARLSARTGRYLCPAFESRVAPGELRIPAVRGPDDGLLYLVERGPGTPRFFEVDFEPLDGAEQQGLGLTRIDHVSRAVAPSEFLSTILFYRSVLGFEVSAPTDIVDPHGMVLSRALTAAEGAIRFPLNTSHASQSITERFRARYAGSGVQHIALACDDILAVAPRLNPLHVLPVPANYYADLEARWGLDAELIESLERHHVLYDEREDGRYFQIYTRSINGLFFEIVQRDRYQGYGESNAAVRVAAQQREFEKLQAAVSVGTSESW